MAPIPVPSLHEHQSVIWPVQSFTVDHEFKSPAPAHLLLDRANSEIGLIYQIAPRVAVLAKLPDSDDPIFIRVSATRAACSREGNSCKKVCVLLEHMQIDLEFTTADDASVFLHTLGRLATRVGNLKFDVFEAQSLNALNRPEFSVEKMCVANQPSELWKAVRNTDTFDWASVYKSGKCSDFSIIAGQRTFPVHRILLCTRSQYFNAVCDGRFSEAEQKSISLPESKETISTMLQELYGVYNPTTGSIFANFALRREIEKESVMNNLLALFVTCDKYNLESIKQKAAEAIKDRLPFVQDTLNIIDIAAHIFDESFPETDCGLRKAIDDQVQSRLPTIMGDEAAWESYASNRMILKAIHETRCAQIEDASSVGLCTPPVTPTKGGKKYRAQDRPTSMAPDAGSVNGIPADSALKPLQKPSVTPNVLEVVFGSLLIKPWYPSFYPEGLVGGKVERLYICQWCFKYSKELMGFLGHLKACPHRSSPPPGVNVYTKGNYSLYEIDGEKHKLYAQNLSLFAKLFLDTKSVFYDVTTFLYYLLVAHDPTPSIPHTNLGGDGVGEQGQVVGFFSKEKMSWDNNNLACILVFPPWQKQGLGQILMGASYEMSRREGRLGGPEKPLSDLGRLAYVHYWSATLARTILSCPSKKTLTVLDLREKTYIVPEDIIATLQAMEVLDHKKRGGAEAVINKAKVRAWAESHRVDLKTLPVDSKAFVIRDSSRSASKE
ncbi:histone acetyltransferase MYST2 [Setomelanomma holmii]|uniref:histone acetyltransferase n=1 Tax=Setomelanomma holmii TaxID=210430 RepID=A0A9P4LL10_9PLEO|nr:histone acetyltransferase MYST2 [Setomelanomma holmii]